PPPRPPLPAPPAAVRPRPRPAAPPRAVDAPPAVRRPHPPWLRRRRRRDPHRIAAALRAHREHLAPRDERELLAIWREREVREPGCEAQPLHRIARRRAAQPDRHLPRLTARHIQRPDREPALERDGPAVTRDARPQHAPVAEARERARCSFRRAHPHVLRAVAV